MEKLCVNVIPEELQKQSDQKESKVPGYCTSQQCNGKFAQEELNCSEVDSVFFAPLCLVDAQDAEGKPCVSVTALYCQASHSGIGDNYERK
ncbi:hypothetical protein Anapl_07149 [Anas platyrhynchos]|uniref:Uncharacterized protein n=1 Tax=Anas platyrhynchos TaxID=8839 RepID=R0JPH2_ANAPL|nr:hypothetical protein Anapl_07149 [Anas platyrhynchos]